MPYSENSGCRPPSNGQQKLWRYMDLAKFLSLIDQGSLYFPSIQTLLKDDPYEGAFPRQNIDAPNFTVDPALIAMLESMPEDGKEQMLESMRRSNALQRSMNQLYMGCTFVSCWHSFDHESAAMWHLYTRAGQGVAIQTTFDDLKAAFAACDQHTIYISEVTYRDYEVERLSEGHVFYPFLSKRLSYLHEFEVRALIWDTPDPGGDLRQALVNAPIRAGISVPVDLQRLIQAIYVSPTSDAWLVDTIKSVTRKLGIDKGIVHSNLLTSPLR